MERAIPTQIRVAVDLALGERLFMAADELDALQLAVAHFDCGEVVRLG